MEKVGGLPRLYNPKISSLTCLCRREDGTGAFRGMFLRPGRAFEFDPEIRHEPSCTDHCHDVFGEGLGPVAPLLSEIFDHAFDRRDAEPITRPDLARFDAVSSARARIFCVAVAPGIAFLPFRRLR